MEKKNTILLTVIAIATLLVAVVGATFAYFTANVTTSNEGNKTTTVKTAAMVNSNMNMGDKIDVTNALPGFKTVKTVQVTGTCQDGTTTCTTTGATITITPNVTAFGSDVKYTLYKRDNTGADKNKEITCTNTNNATTSGNTAQFSTTGTCTIPDGWTPVIAEAAFAGTTPVTHNLTVNGGMDETYFLVVEYVNTGAAQDAQQGKSFTVDIDFSINGAATITTNETKTPGTTTP